MRTPSSFSLTCPVEQDTLNEISDDLLPLDDRGVKYRGITETRGADEIWRFLIDVDWASVRDNLVAAGIAAGAGGTALAAQHSFRRLGRILSGASRRLQAPATGQIQIQDRMAGITIQIDVKSAAEEQPWDALPNSNEGSMMWSPEKNLWIPRD